MTGLTPPGEHPFDSSTILLVEDSDNDVFLMKRAFQKAELLNPVSVVGDGEQAVAYLEGTGPYADRKKFPLPSLVLLDLNLPKKTGHQVLEWIRGAPAVKHLVVYIMSASTRVADIRTAFAAGANAYLVKPGRLDDLVGIARSLRDFGRCQAFPPIDGHAPRQ